MTDFILEKAQLLILLAFLTESLTEIIKGMFSKWMKDQMTYFISILIGIILCYAFGMNLFGMQHMGKHVSIVSAGLIVSRGANYVHSFVKNLGMLSKGRQ
ncbi:hypothetical protein O0555_03785 [Brevibacillus laterosporus]|uniref:hypothetical protein n=1 Tax=Brevibacillus laterosporus TaxID=1465 RepID=UPI00036FDCBB|nr:hypothetical protein [Brevibacillus laterosporus]ATO51393.1 hypothetical protein BrL25_21200 [Brevibacillus laterosporus DSM 25]MBG9799701.1 hypothetical protein [Brevibacillus laterosporus]MBG9801210.1 hypothetical protein [Brevibacillus laterosporus]MCR8936474.1 hypothetical protein [Brevibacillus laterosporus]MCZ0839113.1 hypothetical protein [Brevibacillus laterosporus]